MALFLQFSSMPTQIHYVLVLFGLLKNNLSATGEESNALRCKSAGCSLSQPIFEMVAKNSPRNPFIIPKLDNHRR